MTPITLKDGACGAKYYRYTQANRNYDVRKTKYIRIRECLKTEYINGELEVRHIEATLSIFDSKTTDFKKFEEYVCHKITVNDLLDEHYKRTIYRKLKWNTYINTHRSEDMMLNNFRKKFGSYQNAVIILGDYSEKNHKKGNEPTILKRLRTLFKKELYEVYLIDEFRTSKLCHKCESETENFEE